MKPFQIANCFDILGQSQRAYGRQLEPVCKKWQLTRNELDVMLFLYNNPEFDRAADIVTRRGIAKSHVSMSVASLTARGLLERRFSETDRRTAHLSLTEQGSVIAAEARKAQKAFFALLYDGVTEEEFRQWDSITRKICENINRLEK